MTYPVNDLKSPVSSSTGEPSRFLSLIPHPTHRVDRVALDFFSSPHPRSCRKIDFGASESAAPPSFLGKRCWDAEVRSPSPGLSLGFPLSPALSAESKVDREAKRRRGPPSYDPLFVPSPPAGSPPKIYQYSPEDTVEKLPLFLRNAIKAQQERRIFVRGDQPTSITIRKDLMNGEFHVIAEIAPGQPPVVPEMENEALLVKILRDHAIMLKNDTNGRKVCMSDVTQILGQYRRLKEIKCPVATIHNLRDAEAGCGFLLVERIPHPFPIWALGTKMTDLTPPQREGLRQATELLRLTHRAGVIPDLKPENLRLTEDGVAVLVDLREKEPEESARDAIFRTMITSFRCKEGDEIHTHLTAAVFPLEEATIPIVSTATEETTPDFP